MRTSLTYFMNFKTVCDIIFEIHKIYICDTYSVRINYTHTHKQEEPIYTVFLHFYHLNWK